ncbi:hypothetical protein UY3_14718 [Chelonia mydas]|uniref:Ig-like domain-containing protein n=1 Tax=Chelonia mydas TaxID=8469 RepID=M7B7N2_CHEMY|nr:hypothetical protein UY3_14718 [Chelonia mydas]
MAFSTLAVQLVPAPPDHGQDPAKIATTKSRTSVGVEAKQGEWLNAGIGSLTQNSNREQELWYSCSQYIAPKWNFTGKSPFSGPHGIRPPGIIHRLQPWKNPPAAKAKTPPAFGKRSSLGTEMMVSCCEAQVDQSPQSLVTWEGEVVTLSCAFTTEYQTFHWYQQLPGRGLTCLLAVSPHENATEQQFVGQPLEDGKRSPLHITSYQLGDSGSYL